MDELYSGMYSNQPLSLIEIYMYSSIVISLALLFTFIWMKDSQRIYHTKRKNTDDQPDIDF
jgi:hypothetical protein